MSDDAGQPMTASGLPDPTAERQELGAQVRRLRRWVIGLAVLAAFLTGGLGGGAAIWWRQAHQPGAAIGLARAVQVYGDPSERRAFRNALAEGRRAARPQVRDLQDARTALAVLLAEPSPSTAALQAALARLRQADVTLRDSLEPRIAEALAGFSVDRRRAIADAIAPRGRRGAAAEE